MFGELTVYNTYATMPTINPICMGFSGYTNALKEIGFQQSSASYDASEKYITPQDFLAWGVFCKNCGTINKVDFSVVCVYVSEASSGSTYERLHSICVF